MPAPQPGLRRMDSFGLYTVRNRRENDRGETPHETQL